MYKWLFLLAFLVGCPSGKTTEEWLYRCSINKHIGECICYYVMPNGYPDRGTGIWAPMETCITQDGRDPYAP